MPIFLIVLSIAALFGVGTFFLRSSEQYIPEPVAVTAPETPATTSVAQDTPMDSNPVPTSEPVATTAPATPTTVPTTTVTPTPKPPVTAVTTYKNASYNASADYNAPGRTNHIVAVNLTVANDIVTDVSVSYSGDKSGESSQYQKRFSGSIQSQVVGKKLDSISLSRVGGASLTTNAFNEALVNIKASAQS
jgi:hypothetical protein